MSKTTQASQTAKLSLDRIFAITMAVISVIALFLPYRVIKNNGASYSADLGLLFSGFNGALKGEGLVSFICIILMVLSMAATATFSIIAFLNEDYQFSLLRVASLTMSAGAGLYALTVPALSSYVASLGTKFDVVSLLVAVIGVGFYGWFAFTANKNKRELLKSAAQYGLTLLSTILMAAALGLGTAGKANPVHVVLFVLAEAGLVFSLVCLAVKFEEPMVHRVRLIAQLAIALLFFIVCLFTLGIQSFIFSFIGAVVAAVPVADNFLNLTEENDETKDPEYTYKDYTASEEEEYGDNEEEPEMFPSIPRPKMVAQEESIEEEVAVADAEAEVVENNEEALQNYQATVLAEAYAYEGGPVNGVALAEEINPAFAGVKGELATAGYDFYNCQSFDPFIASLTQEERNQFTELFILRYKGVMPEIPDYVVGGENSEFFRMIFIYLGQYRERIPNGLLNKIYIYSTKIS